MMAQNELTREQADAALGPIAQRLREALATLQKELDSTDWSSTDPNALLALSDRVLDAITPAHECAEDFYNWACQVSGTTVGLTQPGQLM
ncbi:MAG: hypothetical protein IKH84_06930 [Ottowia sp.]|nr:hypothetical protein [Ottowia sp.]